MDIDIRKTQKYYHSISADDLCDCNYCKNYYSQIKSAYPLVAGYLASMGIDIEKPFELSPLEIDEKGFLEYCDCQYIVFGSCKAAYSHKIGNIEFRLTTLHPDTGMKDKYFVLEFDPIFLKWNIAE